MYMYMYMYILCSRRCNIVLGEPNLGNRHNHLSHINGISCN